MQREANVVRLPLHWHACRAKANVVNAAHHASHRRRRGHQATAERLFARSPTPTAHAQPSALPRSRACPRRSPLPAVAAHVPAGASAASLAETPAADRRQNRLGAASSEHLAAPRVTRPGRQPRRTARCKEHRCTPTLHRSRVRPRQCSLLVARRGGGAQVGRCDRGEEERWPCHKLGSQLAV